MQKNIRFKIEPKLNDKQMLIAKNRYLMLDKKGKPKERIRAMFIRVSKFIASAEQKYRTSKQEIKSLEEDFYNIQANFEFISGIVLNDRGKKKLMGDCYVLPLEDNLESIYGTLYNSVKLHRLGAGIGYDFSKLRPEGSLVHSTGKESSGPISFMRLYDFSSEVILNRGSARHAGHMGILRIDHPDIEKFIEAKEDYTQLTNFNLSVAITDKFMRAYKLGKDFVLSYPSNGKTRKKVSARRIMNKLARSTHRSGEPGVIFIDEINKNNTLPKLAKITATNLCGEQPLLPYESCNLGSVVLNKFINNPEGKDFKSKIDLRRLEKVVRLGVRFLDNTVNLAYYTLKQSREVAIFGNRKIGLGVMGWADLLAELNIPYDSDHAVGLAELIIKFIRDKARDESRDLGKVKGNFGNFKKSIFPKLGYKHMRNATVTTIAPNGTISLFTDCNGGIEPFFALSYVRKNMETLGNKTLTYVNRVLIKRLQEEWLYNKKLLNKIGRNGGIQNQSEIPHKIKNVFKTTYEIDPIWHLKMQAAFQKYTDNAVSKTINVQEHTTIKDIEKILVQAYELNLKGVTIYRDKSRDKQVLNLKT